MADHELRKTGVNTAVLAARFPDTWLKRSLGVIASADYPSDDRPLRAAALRMLGSQLFFCFFTAEVAESTEVWFLVIAPRSLRTLR